YFTKLGKWEIVVCHTTCAKKIEYGAQWPSVYKIGNMKALTLAILYPPDLQNGPIMQMQGTKATATKKKAFITCIAHNLLNSMHFIYTIQELTWAAEAAGLGIVVSIMLLWKAIAEKRSVARDRANSMTLE
ncbi:hypothetical protein ACJX0J_028840, partial [Zea mays]